MRHLRLLQLLAAALVAGAFAVAPASAGADPQTADREAAALLQPPTLRDPATVTIDPGHTTLKLSGSRDYVVRIAAAILTHSVTIVGGHNVVLEPGTLRYAPPQGAKPTWLTRGLYLKGQTGTMYVSGLSIRGPLNEGINLDQRVSGATVVLKDIAIDPVSGSRSGHHADLLQTWAGPSRLVVDGFTGSSNYQGFFLTPNQRFTTGPKPKLFYLRDVDLDVRTGSYALWTVGHDAFPLEVRSTRVQINPSHPSRDSWLWPKPSTGDTTWRAVTAE